MQKVDKSNSVVIVEKDVHLRHMETILGNLTSLKKLASKKEFWIFQLTIKKVWTIIWRGLKNQEVCLPNNIKKN